MNNDLHDQANIENLTGLWKAMGGAPVAGVGMPRLHVCARWPNRCWLDGAGGEEDAALLERALPDIPERGIVPVWGVPAGRAAALEALLLGRGFVERSWQMAMVLERAHVVLPEVPAARVVEARSDAELAEWTRVGSASFGYAIDETVVRRLAEDPVATLLLLEEGGEAAATALIFRAGNVAGIHQVGVPPAFRGRGLARAIMVDVLRRCVDMPITIVTLQASSAGRRLYDQLGFAAQFAIRNYQRKSG